jgi:putative flippase GtrA
VAERRVAARYAAASVVTVVVGQVLLFALYAALGWSARLSYAVAFCASAALSFVLNRRWAWGRTGPASLAREIMPFWGIVAVTFVLATFAAGWAEGRAETLTDARWAQAVLVDIAAFATVGAVWIVRFFALDRLFAAESAPGAGVIRRSEPKL